MIPQKKKKCWFIISYVQSISENFKNIIKDTSTKLLFFSLNKLSSIKAQKNPLPADCKKNIMYQISCNDCNESYVRQTCRQLKTRISEHKNDINRNKINPLLQSSLS